MRFAVEALGDLVAGEIAVMEEEPRISADPLRAFLQDSADEFAERMVKTINAAQAGRNESRCKTAASRLKGCGPRWDGGTRSLGPRICWTPR